MTANDQGAPRTEAVSPNDRSHRAGLVDALARYLHFAAMSRRCKRRTVSGVTLAATRSRAARPMPWSLASSLRRGSSFSRTRRPRSCSRSRPSVPSPRGGLGWGVVVVLSGAAVGWWLRLLGTTAEVVDLTGSSPWRTACATPNASRMHSPFTSAVSMFALSCDSTRDPEAPSNP